MHRNPVITTATHTRIQIDSDVLERKCELRGDALRGHQIIDWDSQLTFPCFADPCRVFPNHRLHGTTSPNLENTFFKSFMTALRYRVGIPDKAGRQLHIDIANFTTGRQFRAFAVQEVVECKRDRDLVWMRTSLFISRPFSVADPTIRICDTQPSVGFAKRHRNRGTRSGR